MNKASYTAFKISDSKTIEKYLNFYNNQFKPKTIIEMVGDLKAYSSKLSQNAHFYVLRDGQNWELGFIAFYEDDFDNFIGYLSLVLVNEPYRGKGIGKVLMNLFLSECKKNGMRKVRLEVYKENPTALKLYTKYGFEIEKELQNSYYMIKCI